MFTSLAVTSKKVAKRLICQQAIRAVFFGLSGMLLPASAEDNKSISSSPIATQVDVRGSSPVLDLYERRVNDLRKQRDTKSRTKQIAVSEQQVLDMQLAQLNDKRQNLLNQIQLIDDWKDATFILSSERTAVGVRAGEAGDLRLHSLASTHESNYVHKIAQRYRIPLVKQDDPAFESLAGGTGIGEPFSQASLAVLGKYWKVRQYVPSGSNDDGLMVVFKDQETNKHRVGYFVDLESRSLKFHPVGLRTETIPRQQIQSGTARRGNCSQLMVEPEVDYLDLAALEIARNLSSKTNIPSYHAVALDVDVDELEEAVALSKQLDETYNDRVLDLVSRLNGEKYVADQRKEGTRIVRRYAKVLHDELSSRLVQTGVPMIAREELSTIIQERELSEGKHFDQKRHGQLTSASHLITAKAGKPENGGAFRVSIRLVDVQSGSLLYEINADVGRPALQYPSNYYVHGGELVLLTDKTNPNASNRKQASKPLLIDEITDLPVSNRLGLAAVNGSKVHFQDLFSTNSQSLSMDRFGFRKIDNDVLAIPPVEKLRWLTWQLMRSSLPTAGRVMLVDDERVEINIGSNHDIQPGTVFRVMRFKGSNFKGNQMVLPMELRADTVTPTLTTAFVQRDGLEQLWSDSSVGVGDVVIRRGALNSQIRIVPPEFNQNMMNKFNRDKLNLAIHNPQQKNRLAGSINQLRNKLMLKIVQGMQSQGITSIGSNLTNPTHEIVGTLAPIDGTQECTKFSVAFSVKSILDERVPLTLPAIPISLNEIDAWQP